MTPELLKKALDKYGEKVKVLVLNYPVNPTGVTYTPDEVRALADLLKDYNVAILDDEIYADLLYEGEHLPMAKLLPDQTLYVSGVSKNAAMTGWRVGYICGPRDVLGALAKVHQAAISTNATMNMDAAEEALRHGKADTAQMKAEYDRRRQFLMMLARRNWPIWKWYLLSYTSLPEISLWKKLRNLDSVRIILIIL